MRLVLHPLVIPMHTLTVRPQSWIFWATPQGCQWVVMQGFGPTPSGGISRHTDDGSRRTGGAPHLWRGMSGGGGEEGAEGGRSRGRKGGEKEKKRRKEVE